MFWQVWLHLLHRPLLSHSLKTDFPLPSEHLVNHFKVSFSAFVYAQTHNRAAAQLMSITLGAGTFKPGKAHLFCLVCRKPHQNYLQLQTTKIIRAVKLDIQTFGSLGIGKYVAFHLSLMKQRTKSLWDILTSSLPRWDVKM